MKHLSELRIQGYQSHKDTTIELDPGLNVLVGMSDAGKTAVIRAIRWALYNEPLGKDFFNYEMNRATVSLGFTDGTQITRHRTPSENLYEIKGTPPFTGFGSNPPPEILNAHGMTRVSIGDREISLNAQFQHDTAFLLQGAGVESFAAKVLGRLADVEPYDNAAKAISSDIIRAQRRRTVLADDIVAKTTAIQEYQYLDDWEARSTKVQEMLQTAADLQGKAEKVKGAYNSWVRNSNYVVQCQERLESLQFIQEAEVHSSEIAADILKASQLGKIIERLSSIIEVRAQAEEVLEKTKGIQEAQEILQDARIVINKADETQGAIEKRTFWRRVIIQEELFLLKTTGLGQAQEALTEIASMIERATAINRVGRAYTTQQMASDLSTWKLEDIAKFEVKAATYLSKVPELLDKAAEIDRTKRQYLEAENTAASLNRQLVLTETRISDLEGAVADQESQIRDFLSVNARCSGCGTPYDMSILENLIGA